jgi:hypothetical protein
MPDFREIARLLGQGHFPLVSDRLWNGGAFLQEHQLAVFNPVSMLLYLARMAKCNLFVTEKACGRTAFGAVCLGPSR